MKDTLNALSAMVPGKRTKTALSNNAFSCTPIDAYRHVYLGKTGGQVTEWYGRRTGTVRGWRLPRGDDTGRGGGRHRSAQALRTAAASLHGLLSG